MQIQGKDRAAVAEAGRRLGLDGTYIARSYIEQVTSLVGCIALHFIYSVVKLDDNCLINDITFMHSCKHAHECATVMYNGPCIVHSRPKQFELFCDMNQFTSILIFHVGMFS